jgi:hypothetical protein
MVKGEKRKVEKSSTTSSKPSNKECQYCKKSKHLKNKYFPNNPKKQIERKTINSC